MQELGDWILRPIGKDAAMTFGATESCTETSITLHDPVIMLMLQVNAVVVQDGSLLIFQAELLAPKKGCWGPQSKKSRGIEYKARIRCQLRLFAFSCLF